ncbi:hypothetical protein CDIK_1210 [Cucumispora dikerogammari]|nr:hypothetical protein CDIK_1210 [Cucumispora dikerogammari]
MCRIISASSRINSAMCRVISALSRVNSATIKYLINKKNFFSLIVLMTIHYYLTHLDINFIIMRPWLDTKEFRTKKTQSIINAYNNGTSSVEISRLLNVKRSTVQTIVKNYLKTGLIDRKIRQIFIEKKISLEMQQSLKVGLMKTPQCLLIIYH